MLLIALIKVYSQFFFHYSCTVDLIMFLRIIVSLSISSILLKHHKIKWIRGADELISRSFHIMIQENFKL